jgi:hypothetical protein
MDTMAIHFLMHYFAPAKNPDLRFAGQTTPLLSGSKYSCYYQDLNIVAQRTGKFRLFNIGG